MGAKKGNVWLIVLGHGGKMALAGVTIGLGGAFALTRLMTSLLFGVSPTDPLTFAAIPIVLIGIVFIASMVPALRATRLDPMDALRYE
jgi:putative ABC transport system permease protein